MSRRGGDASLPQSPSSPASADGARQRKNSRGASDSSEDDVDHFLYKEDLDKLLIFTKSIPPPNPLATMRELRFVFRAVQLCVAIGSFISLSLSSFDVNYPSTLIGTSGINFMCATSVSSMMVSISCMFLYLFPHLLGIPPVRHPRFSRVEVATDLFWIAFWIAASTVGAVFGNCPRKFFDPITKDNNSCVPWNLSMILGYLTAVMFAVTFTMGVVDLKKYGWGYATGKFSANEGWVGWARGSWASHSDI
ncbi:hypothetical protein M427DRAFT_55126 [Gonapodya prolifera JEL478]|uniref:MARVEL domain-containing protein n=1 Tax=Gonapodya prolifera (strain JEL478) TaxID=1344416 RepID=A0A139AJ76_GONPJ|nr:hypothetical protein M427DRAFT_55126 [Gonapodya prolifera JEL478]|eukprot:KXS16789.1 hypothetical protein M427DRAFT_55126 [Gonapodya prolifera JEL478]